MTSFPMIAATVAAAAGVIAYAAWRTVKQRTRNRALKRICSAKCPQCSAVYGDGIRETASLVEYEWTLARGQTMQSLKLPYFTYLVPCGKCQAEFEFAEDGSLFEHPQQGVLHYTRIGRLRLLPPATERGGTKNLFLGDFKPPTVRAA